MNMKTTVASVIIHKTSNKVWNSEIFENVAKAKETADAKIPSKNRHNYRVVTIAQLIDLLDSYQATNVGADVELDENFGE